MKIETYSQLDNKLFKEWESVWEKSKNAHIFNSPHWYEACINSQSYKKLLIVACRSKTGDLLGILPLVLDKRLGISAYMSPGNNYLDKSSLLINFDNPGKILRPLLLSLSKMGNVYLTELPEEETRQIKNISPNRSAVISSVGRYLPTETEPFKYTKHANVRRTRKRIRDIERHIRLEFFSPENLHKYLRILNSIERGSSKKNSFKTVFSDKFLISLCSNLQKQSNNILKISLLYYDDKPICYLYGFYAKNIYHSCNTAYKSKYSQMLPGKVVTFLTIDELAKNGLKGVDFSRGDNAFKTDFTPFTYTQYSLLLTKNPLLYLAWELYCKIKPSLQNSFDLFEIIRIIKSRYASGFLTT